VSEDLAFVLVRGTKRATRWRTVPIVSRDQRTLLEYTLEHAKGPKEGALFEEWQNIRRDLREACRRVGIETCSPNDLRRTCLSWLRASGVAPHLLAPLAGHADSRMVERVYGRLQPAELAALIADQLPKGAAATAAHLQRTGRETVDSVASVDTRRDASSSEVAPRAGFEPATHGLTVRCSAS